MARMLQKCSGHHTRPRALSTRSIRSAPRSNKPISVTTAAMLSSDQPSIVTAEWLEENLSNPKVHVLDASWFLPTMGRSAIEEFKSARIPGSKFFDIDGVADLTTSFPHMSPPSARFAAAADVLGISDSHDTTVVLYDRVGTFSCGRAWWLWKSFGQEKVAILAGGFPAWKAAGRPIDESAVDDAEIGAPKEAAQTEHAGYVYPASANSKFVRSMDDVKEGLADPNVQVVDVRSADRFRGLAPEPRADISPGHMAGSMNLPFTDLLQGSSPAGLFKSEDDLRKVIQEAGVDLNKPIICTCGSGATAAIFAHALYQLTGTLYPIYDGSWMEWATSGNEIISEA